MRATTLLQVNRRTAGKLAVTALAMFGFGFLLSPLYDLFCQVVGLNGKTGRLDVNTAAITQVDKTRTVTVEFTGLANSGLPWKFRPMQKKIEVHPGEMQIVKYYVHNTAGQAITGQAIPSVTPGRAAAYFKKIECFCFSEQKLAAGEAREMPVQFMVTPDLTSEIQTITLSYTFFNIDKTQAHRYNTAADILNLPPHDSRTARAGS